MESKRINKTKLVKPETFKVITLGDPSVGKTCLL